MNVWNDEHTVEFMEKAKKVADALYLENQALYFEGLSNTDKITDNTKKISYNNQQLIVLKKLTLEVAKANALYRLEQMES